MKPFLFVTANLNERAAFEKRFKVEDEKRVLGKTYYIGQFGNYKAAYIHIHEQGVTNPSSTPLVGELIRELQPVAVIMAGIAFGIDERNQKVGDVLVSKQILPYDSQKLLETGTYYKDTPKEAGFQLLNAFCDFESWEHHLDGTGTSTVFIGGILTGSRLINNYAYRSKLIEDFSAYKPIGGEMEAYGIYSACKFYGVTEWIIVKGICDWGYNKETPNKENDQKVAANAALDLCHFVFSRIGAFDSLIKQDKETEQHEHTRSKFTVTNNNRVGNQKIVNIENFNGNINF